MAPVPVTPTPIGGPTVLIEADGVRLLTDPTFDAPGSYPLPHVTLESWSDRPWPWTRSEVSTPSCSATTSAPTISIMAGGRCSTGWPLVLTTRAGAGRLGGNARGLAPWETATLAGPNGSHFQVTATPARHGSAGIEPLSGAVVGFLVGVEQPGDLLYVTGDTVWYQRVAPSSHAFATVGLAERLTLLQPGPPVRLEV
jgi:hypothetical protein